MKKIINKRPILFFAVIMLISLITVIYNDNFILKIILSSIFGVATIVGIVLLICLKSNICKLIFSRLMLCGLAVLVAIGVVAIDKANYIKDYEDYSGTAIISGRISEVGEAYSEEKRNIVLDNVHVHTDSFDKELNHKAIFVVILNYNDDNIFVVGKTIDAVAKISFSKLNYINEDGRLSFYHKNKDITVSGYILEEHITLVDNNLKLSLADRVKNKVEEIVNANLDSEYASLAMGMMFGEKRAIDGTIYRDFTNAGIAHIFAVSGLHVAFFVSLIMLILKLFRCKNFIKFIIISALLVFYSYLCGFTYSVLRASIMAICMLLGLVMGKKYDALNSLAIAFIIITCIFPYSITSVGFQLSFTAVLSIILLARPITDLLDKIMYRKLASTIAVIIAVQIGTSLILLKTFNHISMLAVASNFICIPIASLAYFLLMITTFVAIVCPPIAINVYLFQFVMQFAVKFIHLVAPYGIVSRQMWQADVATALLIPTCFLSSEYFMAKKPVKAVMFTTLWAVLAIVIFI